MTVARNSTADAPARLAAMWTACMEDGDFEAAWRISDLLRERHPETRRPGVPRHFQTIWDGSPVDGRRVLVRCYHGLGDTIQFIRYAPLLRERAREISVWAQPKLLPLLRTIDAIDRLLPLHDGTPDVDYDVDLEVMELPYLFRTTVDSIPAAVPYLRVPPIALSRVHGPAVGLVWSGGDWVPQRSIDFAMLRPLFRLPITWHVLQFGPALAECPAALGVRHDDQGIEQTARIIGSLDLLLTIDSMPAHVAGALGTPVWTLLPAPADWRWMRDREDSPWYPSMRLLRQARSGDWSSVIARARHLLQRAGPRCRAGEPSTA